MNNAINNNPAKSYFDGMLWAAFGSRMFINVVAEWQIDMVKECAMKLKEAEIEHSSLSEDEKKNLKCQWKLHIENYTQGFKDELRSEGRMM